jgi:ABC-2 type transport system permease protein
MFSVLLPIFLLVIFGSVFGKGSIYAGSNVTFAQYMVAGLLASGLIYGAFQQLAIAIPEERSNGTLKRLVGTPMPKSVYFVGKLAVSAFIYIFQAIALLGLGHLFYNIHMPVSAHLWLIFIGVSILGLISSALLGVAFSSLAKDGKSASALAAPLVLFFQFTSGVFFVYASLPTWMQDIAAVFPLKWLAQSMRGVFLPANFSSHEVAQSFEFGRGFLILAAWSIVASALCWRTFRWLGKGRD